MMESHWPAFLVAVVIAGAAACSTTGDDPTNGGGGSSGDGGSLPVGDCRSDDDCDINIGETCIHPGNAAASSCGGCIPPETICTSDDECKTLGDHYVCPADTCGCGTSCIPGCLTDGDCMAEHLACGLDHRCEPRSCAVDDDCPDDFACGLGDDPRCIRRTCSSDSECDDYCVFGKCYPQLGTCGDGPA